MRRLLDLTMRGPPTPRSMPAVATSALRTSIADSNIDENGRGGNTHPCIQGSPLMFVPRLVLNWRKYTTGSSQIKSADTPCKSKARHNASQSTRSNAFDKSSGCSIEVFLAKNVLSMSEIAFNKRASIRGLFLKPCGFKELYSVSFVRPNTK